MVFWEFKIRGHGDFSTFDDGIDGATFLFFYGRTWIMLHSDLADYSLLMR